MTKDSEEFSQFTDSVACREYTLPRDESLTDPKGWIRVNTKIGPVLEVTTFCLQGKYGVEIRIESMNKDHSHSWVRISHGFSKLVTDLNDNEQETSEMQFEDFALKTNALAFASRSKAKAKPRRPTSGYSSTRTVSILERILIGIEPGAQFDQAYPVAKRINTLLRHGKLHREEDGAIEFWRIKDDLQNHFVHSDIGLMKSGRAAWQEEEETRKYFSIVLILQEKFFTSELFKVIQDAMPLILHYRTMY